MVPQWLSALPAQAQASRSVKELNALLGYLSCF